MKKLIIYLIFICVTHSLNAQIPQLHFRFSAPHIIEGVEDTFKFHVQLKCDSENTWLRDNDVFLDYNSDAFGEYIAGNGLVFVNLTGIAYTDPFTNPLAPLYNIVNVADNTSARVGIISETNYPGKFGGEQFLFNGSYYDFNQEVPTDWTDFLEISLIIEDEYRLAGIQFTDWLMDGNQYYSSSDNNLPVKYCIPNIYNNNLVNEYLTSPLITEWTGQINNAWDYGMNWSNGVPDQYSRAVIPNETVFPLIKNAEECYQVEIQSGGRLDIAAAGSLTVFNEIVNDGVLNVLGFETSRGSLINFQDPTGSGIFNISFELTGYTWHFLSSPIMNQSVTQFTGNFLKRFSESTDAWVQVVDPGYTFVAGEGYASWSECDKDTIVFTGSLVSNGLNISVNCEKSGWNLIGNPYLSSIDWEYVILGDSIEPTIYQWDGTANNYYTYTQGVGGAGSRYLPSCQGGFVKTSDDASLYIPDSARTHENQNSFYKSGPENDFISLIVEGNGYSDRAFIRWDARSTMGFDSRLDARKLFSFHDSVPQICINAGNSLMALNSIPDSLPLGVNFYSETNGIFNLKISLPAGLDRLFLKDHLLDALFEVKGELTYSFVHQKENDAGRFELMFDDLSQPGSYLNFDVVYCNGQPMISNLNQDRAEARIYDMNGRLMSTFYLHAGINVIPSLTSGYYLIQVFSGKSSKSAKILAR